MSDNTWTIDPAHSQIEFAVRHLMIATVRGRFSEFSGLVTFDPEQPTKGRAEVTIQAASIDTRTADRDTHLRSPDFFDVERFPTLTFRSTRVEPRGQSFTLTGDLTIRDITRPVTLDVTLNGRAKDPWGNERLGFSASTKLSRKEFGLTWNQALETGGVLVGDDVSIQLEVQLVAEAARAAA